MSTLGCCFEVALTNLICPSTIYQCFREWGSGKWCGVPAIRTHGLVGWGSRHGWQRCNTRGQARVPWKYRAQLHFTDLYLALAFVLLFLPYKFAFLVRFCLVLGQFLHPVPYPIKYTLTTSKREIWAGSELSGEKKDLQEWNICFNTVCSKFLPLCFLFCKRLYLFTY